MNSQEYADLQEELAKLGQLSARERQIFENGFHAGRAYEGRRKLGRMPQ